MAGRPVDPALAMTASPLREGVVVGLGGPVGLGVHDPDVGGVAEVRVVGGPDAGRVHRLPLGEFVLGSAHDADAYVADRTVSARQARLLVTPDAVRWTPYEGAAPARVESRELTGEREVKPGQLIAVGSTRLVVVPAGAPDAALVPSDDGGLAYNRPPRLPPAPPNVTVEMPTEPEASQKRPIPVLASLAPLAIGVALYLFTKQVIFLLFTLLSPVLLLSGWLTERRQGKRSHRQQLADYRRDLAAAKRTVTEAARSERRMRRHDAPDPAEVLVTALGPRRRLWERRRWDSDRLLLRLGTARLRSSIELTGGSRKDRPEPPMLDDVPVTVPLPEAGGVLGVAGPHREVHATARWLVAQAAVLHSPRDLSVIVLTGADGRADWEWTRWLPHARPDGREVGLADRQLGRDDRPPGQRAGRPGAAAAGPAGGRPRHAGAGPAPAWCSWCWTAPASCGRCPGCRSCCRTARRSGSTRSASTPRSGCCRRSAGWSRATDPAEPSTMTVRRAFGERVDGRAGRPRQRRLVRAGGPGDDRGARRQPGGGRQRAADLAAAARRARAWSRRRRGGSSSGWAAGGRTTAAPIGASATGAFTVDMKKDGPHALVAGTTGSGKSELLQSIVASLRWATGRTR